MIKHRVVVHHPNTDNYWYGEFTETDIGDIPRVKTLMKELVAGDYKHITLNKENEVFFFSPEFIKECVITLETTKYDA